MDIAVEEKEILQHTLGLDRGINQYRNYFYADKNSSDFIMLERLCSLGLMIKTRDMLNEMSESFVYSCTPEGIRQATI